MRLWASLLVLAGLLLPALANADYTARAVIKASQRAVLSGELAARVERLPLRAGDAFAKGDVLVALDCALYQAQTEKVSAELQAARIRRDNASEMEALNAIGELEVALAMSDFAQARAALTIARLNTSRCNIRAPWDGRVVSVLVNEHEVIRQQQELIEVLSTGALEAEVVVPSEWLRWLKPGMPLQLLVENIETMAEARVIALNPAIDAVSQTVTLRAELIDTGLLVPGMSASARFMPEAEHP
ncbi:efflux RND transporter periplasmic adaptor subunit [Halopseudomonas salegens]|uniref:RND family efflux transporter, MFP subunit n=1 Tax=Halopseudomonas salegens TaxID=1434072 RepID=A0A1H2E6Q4_9GAMM|nr:efflux RND transporter periplasmic adaptor subunit [Halopseudomonas salegens]SDT90368.1 RND family efflux transporter, MFP subunit [Halopseudomonas salegens]